MTLLFPLCAPHLFVTTAEKLTTMIFNVHLSKITPTCGALFSAIDAFPKSAAVATWESVFVFLLWVKEACMCLFGKQHCLLWRRVEGMRWGCTFCLWTPLFPVLDWLQTSQFFRDSNWTCTPCFPLHTSSFQFLYFFRWLQEAYYAKVTLQSHLSVSMLIICKAQNLSAFSFFLWETRIYEQQSPAGKIVDPFGECLRSKVKAFWAPSTVPSPLSALSKQWVYHINLLSKRYAFLKNQYKCIVFPNSGLQVWNSCQNRQFHVAVCLQYLELPDRLRIMNQRAPPFFTSQASLDRVSCFQRGMTVIPFAVYRRSMKCITAA